MKKTLFISLLLSMASASAMAAEKAPQFIWEPVPGLTSANIARTNWDLVSSDTINWPDGRIALVTYWSESKNHLTMRCVDFKNKDFQDTGALCSQPAVLNK
jgi:hypothetical protein